MGAPDAELGGAPRRPRVRSARRSHAPSHRVGARVGTNVGQRRRRGRARGRRCLDGLRGRARARERTRRTPLVGPGARRSVRRRSERRVPLARDDATARRSARSAHARIRRHLRSPRHPRGDRQRPRRLPPRPRGRLPASPRYASGHESVHGDRLLRRERVARSRGDVPPRDAAHRRRDRPSALPPRSLAPGVAPRDRRSLGLSPRRARGGGARRPCPHGLHGRPLRDSRARRHRLGERPRGDRGTGDRALDRRRRSPRSSPPSANERRTSPAASASCTGSRSPPRSARFTSTVGRSPPACSGSTSVSKPFRSPPSPSRCRGFFCSRGRAHIPRFALSARSPRLSPRRGG